MTGASSGFSRAVAPVCGFSQGTTGRAVSLSCGAREVRPPCAWQGRARHCSRGMEGTRASRRIEEGLSRSFSGCCRKPSFPSTSAGYLRELPSMPLRGQGYCGVGRASPDSTGFEAMKEGLLSNGGRNLRLPLHF